MKRYCYSLLWLLLSLSYLGLLACSGGNKVSKEEAAALVNKYAARISEQVISRPGPPEYSIGRHGGTTSVALTSDIKSYSLVTIRDATSNAVVGLFTSFLFDYDAYKKEFTPDLAESFRVTYNDSNDSTEVFVTLRDNVFWATKAGRREKVTADDIVFWFYEIEGEEKLQMPGYSGQFIRMEDGSKKRIELEKLGELSFRFILPRKLANPLLYVNMNFGPRYLYEMEKQERGIEGVLNLLSIGTEPEEVPSIGPYYLSAYYPGQRIELEKNPHYWKWDEEGQKLPYIEKIVFNIVSEETALLMLKNGELSQRSIRNRELDELLSIEDADFSLFDAGTSLSSMFFTFNQNPNVLDENKLRWFTNKKFRQAMSVSLPRQRIIDEVYRGLGEPAKHFFAKANMFFDPNIRLSYTYDLDRARGLLEEAGFVYTDAVLYDDQDVPVEFDIYYGTNVQESQDVVTLYVQELEKLGIQANVRPLDFQNLVQRITTSYEWDAVYVGLGTNYWPSGGSNVWPSSGNLHLWYPLQQAPETEWERRIDELYQQGLYTLDREERKKVYDEFQSIILEQLPLIYVAHTRSFTAFDNTIENIFIDNLQGSDSIFHYFTE